MIKASRTILKRWYTMAILIVFVAVILTASITPTLASTITPQVSAGGFHTLAIKSDGTLWAWGHNQNGELGLGNTTHQNSTVQVGTDKTWRKVSTGDFHTLAIKSDGTLWAWGKNEDGQLGLGNNDNRDSPVQVGSENNWKNVYTGSYHTLAIKSDGTLWAWGNNENGELGLGDIIPRNSPVQVGPENNWKNVSAGSIHTLAIKSDGTLWAWGGNFLGQLGLGDNLPRNSPVQVGTENTWTSVCAGFWHTLAIKSDGTLWAWGNNENGELGLGDIIPRNSPVQVGTDNTWKNVCAGYYHTLAIKSDGTLWAWGDNFYGQLGLGNEIDKNLPVQVGTDNTWRNVCAGGWHTLAIKSDDTLWAWGHNWFGQLGLGNNIEQKTSPQFVSSLIFTPTITISSPQEGQSYKTVRLNVSADVSIDTWMYNINNTENVTFTPNVTISNLPDGSHSITVFAIDSDENTGSAMVNFIIDNIPPTAPTNLVQTDDAPDGYDNDNSIDISWSASTDTSPVIYHIYRDGVFNALTTSTTYTFTDETEGSHEYNVSANDSVGNINTMNASVSVIVDYTDPVIFNVSMNDTSPGYGQKIVVSANVTDADTNIANVKAGSTSLTHQSGMLWNGTITAGYGTNTVTVTAYDNASNSATNSSLSYKGPDKPTDNGGSSGGGGGGSGVGGSDEPENVEETIYLRKYLKAGGPTTYNFNNVVTSVEVTPDKTYGLVGAKIEVLVDRPASITNDPKDGVLFKYVNVFLGNTGWSEGKLSSSVINFQVPASWLKENNINTDAVTLYRYYDGEWQPLETTMTGQADEYYQYSSPSPGFSTFTILGQVEDSGTGETGTSKPVVTTDFDTVVDSTATKETNSVEGIPGFGMLLGIMGIMIVVLLRKR